VSVRGSKLSSVVDSAYTTNNCDPIIFGDNGISDVDFGSLFATDGTAGDDLYFSKDGFAAGNPFTFEDSLNNKDNITLSGDAFTFDSLVDLDAGHSHTNTITNNNDFQADHDSDDYLNGNLFEDAGPSASNAATSSAQQPLLGASS